MNPIYIKFAIKFAISLIVLSIFISPTISSGFWLRYHDEISRDALSFLKPKILDHIIAANKKQDSFSVDIGPVKLGGSGAYERIHFDACAFRESSAHIQSKYNTLKRQTVDGSDNPIKAASTFGEMLHTVQDFYAHSNWVELDQPKIVDSGLGMWKTIGSWVPLPGTQVPIGKVVTIEEPVKSGWSVNKLGLGSIPIPKVKDPQGNEYIGLISHARETYKFGDHCPGAVQDWNHEQLNKDGDTPRKYAGQIYKTMHERAKDLAKSQTAHEWCRYLNLLKSDPTKGYQAVSVPMALWVDKDKSPHPAGTACKKDALGGGKSVIVSISSIKVINDMDDGNNPGDLNLDFVLYTGDMGRSVRTQVGTLEVQSGAYWPAQKLPPSLTMCLQSSDTLVATVQGWDDEAKNLKGEFNGAVYGIYDFTSGDYQLIAPTDATLKGVTYAASGPTFHGIHTVTSANIEVTFQISQMPYCIPEGVTTKQTDTDKDGVVDSQDNCKGVANPDQKDIDNDRVGDACDLDLKDTDKDGVADSKDNCDFVANPDQKNTNGDEFGDACQAFDQDKDGVIDSVDNCRWVANPDQNPDACKDIIL